MKLEPRDFNHVSFRNS